jgi:preprotein translocase subunit SecA
MGLEYQTELERVVKPQSDALLLHVRKIRQRGTAKLGRNDLCPCGSGKKVKRCHGRGVS